MKRVRGLLFVFVSLFSVGISQISIDGTVGTAGTYATLTGTPNGLFEAINTSGVSGARTFTILENISEPGTIALTRTDLSVTNNVTIKPAALTTPVLTFSGTTNININGGDYVTIDGSNSGGTTRDLTIRHSATSAGNAVIFVQTNSINITVKNCILGGATNTPDFALRVDGASGIQNITIQNNEIHGIGNTNGIIYFNNATGTNLITGNTITGDQVGGTRAVGIYLTGNPSSGTTTITKNTLHTLQTSGTSGLFGIHDFQTGGTVNISNNFIGGNFASSTGGQYMLLRFTGTGTRTAYHNTLVVNTVTSASDANNLYINSGIANFRNNLAINNHNTNFSYCIFNDLISPSDLTTNYNDLYAPGANNGIGYDGFTSYDPLSNWQGAFSPNFPDVNSVSVAVTFVNSASDFHLSGGSNGDVQLRGTNGLASDDIDGNSRLTNPNGPYMGADEASSALPVQLVSFTTSANRLDAVLRWTTATEVNNYGFEVERRAVQGSGLTVQGSEWSKVGFVQGAGTSSSPRDYFYVDAGLPAGRYAYRIKQMDNDGTFEYFTSAELEVGVAAKVLALESPFPNPFNPSTSIEFTLPERGRAVLKVFNIIGQEVAELFNDVAEGGLIYQARFDASALPSGVYISRLEFNGQSVMQKMLFVK